MDITPTYDNLTSILFFAWCNARWSCCVNYSKTSYILFNLTNITNDVVKNNLHITMNNIDISRVCNVKFLGVTMDENLSFKEHIKQLSCKINCLSSMLYKRREFLPLYIRKMIYYSFIYSTICCNVLIYGIANWCNIYRLYTSCNRALRVLQKSIYSCEGFVCDI